MRLFGRREPLHARLAQEHGALLDEPAAPEPTPARASLRPPWDAAGIHGLQRMREWDAVVTVEAPGIAARRAAFVALPGGTILVEDGPDAVDPLAAALAAALAPPYRAEAVRRERGLWVVGGRRIEVVELPGIGAEEIELTSTGRERTLLVDGDYAFGSIPALERPGWAVHARRLDGELWEVEAAPL